MEERNQTQQHSSSPDPNIRQVWAADICEKKRPAKWLNQIIRHHQKTEVEGKGERLLAVSHKLQSAAHLSAAPYLAQLKEAAKYH